MNISALIAVILSKAKDLSEFNTPTLSAPSGPIILAAGFSFQTYLKNLVILSAAESKDLHSVGCATKIDRELSLILHLRLIE